MERQEENNYVKTLKIDRRLFDSNDIDILYFIFLFIVFLEIPFNMDLNPLKSTLHSSSEGFVTNHRTKLALNDTTVSGEWQL